MDVPVDNATIPVLSTLLAELIVNLFLSALSPNRKMLAYVTPPIRQLVPHVVMDSVTDKYTESPYLTSFPNACKFVDGKMYNSVGDESSLTSLSLEFRFKYVFPCNKVILSPYFMVMADAAQLAILDVAPVMYEDMEDPYVSLNWGEMEW
jgi:hypothetical protein